MVTMQGIDGSEVLNIQSINKHQDQNVQKGSLSAKIWRIVVSRSYKNSLQIGLSV